jgi:hypothetical protein
MDAGDEPDPGDTSVQVPPQIRAAVGVLLLESLGLIAAMVVLLVKTVTGHPDDVWRALLGAAFALLGAAVLALGARGLYHLRPTARTPVVVLQVLAIPVAYSLAFQAGRVEYGGPILVAVLVVLYLLFTPPARAALDRDPF